MKPSYLTQPNSLLRITPSSNNVLRKSFPVPRPRDFGTPGRRRRRTHFGGRRAKFGLSSLSLIILSLVPDMREHFTPRRRPSHCPIGGRRARGAVDSSRRSTIPCPPYLYLQLSTWFNNTMNASNLLCFTNPGNPKHLRRWRRLEMGITWVLLFPEQPRSMSHTQWSWKH